MPYKLTLDGGLVRAEALLPAIATLKAWETEGKIEIFEADRPKEVKPAAYGWPGAVPAPVSQFGGRPGARRTGAKKLASSGSTFEQLSAVLFPSRDWRKLNMAEINDVAHLIVHQTWGNDVFVTTNTRDFIELGKRERLLSGFKIIVMNPDETVTMLKDKEGWAQLATASEGGGRRARGK